jgi:cytochrome P450
MSTHILAEPPAGSGLKPVIGSTTPGLVQVLKLRQDPFAYAQANQAKFGDVTFMNVFGTTVVSCAGPDAAERILMNKDRAFANGPAWGYFIDKFFHRGVMLLDFDEHRHHRLILQQAFTPTILKGYMQEMQPMIMNAMKQFPVRDVLLFNEFKQLTLDVALEVFLGLELPKREADKINKAFIDCVRAGVGLIRADSLPFTRWGKGIRSRKVLEEFIYSHIPAKRATETPDLFSVLCHAESEDGHRFTDEDVVNHILFVLMAAHDTSTITMSQMAYHMAKHPQWQEKARAQSLELNPELGYDDLAKLDVLDAIMKESLRMCTPVPAQPRMAVKDTEVNGYFIPEGTMVQVPNLSNHYREEIWTNPFAFDPERYSAERKEDKAHRMAWMPFGGGVHKCIGLYFGQMEIKTIMHHLLRGYEWSVPDDYVLPMDYSSLPVPKDKLPVTIRRR